MADSGSIVIALMCLMLLGAFIADREQEEKQKKMKADFAAHCAYLCAQHAKEKEELTEENQGLAEDNQELEDDLQAAHARIEELEKQLEQAEEELAVARKDAKRAKEEMTFLGVSFLLTVGLGVFFIFLAQVQNSARLIGAAGEL